MGKLILPEGRQLDDVQDVKTGTISEGILTLLARATCVELDGQQRCIDAAQLREAAAQGDVAALQVPEWAAGPVEALRGDHRRIEGLIAPGTWNIDPSATPSSILGSLIAASTSRFMINSRLDTAATDLRMTPYQLLIVASLVQREAAAPDFAKVARVIVNRLAIGQNLELDSTVNFGLKQQEVATTDADRARPTPWNTYVSPGLPATPISAPAAEAVAAAAAPATGDWLYFVTIDAQGTTMFTRDYQEHLANVELARANGVLDSSR